MNEFLSSVISVSLLSVICDLILPKGSMGKYLKLVFGFIMMSMLISPVNKDITLNFEDYIVQGMTEEELNAQSDAYILELHKKNIENRIREICGDDTNVFVELYTDGMVKSVNLIGTDKEKYKAKLKEELGCENITITEG